MGNVNKQRRNLISFFMNLDMGLGIPLQESRLHLTKYVSRNIYDFKEQLCRLVVLVLLPSRSRWGKSLGFLHAKTKKT